MLDEIKGLKIRGANYNELSNLSFFYDKNNSKDYRVLILFGRNGSGKSTIARGFNQLKDKIEDSDLYVEFLGEDKSIDVDESLLSNIHIFNEEYIDKNIRFSEEGLDTIVMLGDTIDVEEKLINAKREKEDVSKELVEQNKILDNYLNPKIDTSAEYWENRIKKSLRGDNNWAGRESRIKQSKQNSGVNNQLYKKIIIRNPEESRDELLMKFNNDLERYLKIENTNTEKIEDPSFNLPHNLSEEYILNLLQKKVENPNLTEREKIILTFGYERLHEINGYFRESDICPYCLSHLSVEEKKSLFNLIERALINEVEKYQSDLKEAKLEKLYLDLKIYEEIDPKLVVKCKNKLDLLNSEIELINSLIDQKINNPSEELDIPVLKINDLYEDIKISIYSLEKACRDFNKDIDNKNKLKNDLIEINNDIAYYDILPYYEKLNQRTEEHKKVADKIFTLKNDLTQIERRIDSFEEEKENIHIAKNIINQGLSYIFFSENRLVLEHSNGKYYLKSNGKSVKPSQISLGESNILGLCYYFSEIMKGKDEREAYVSDYLLILDDPISSFDFENRIGILSYIKYQLGRFIRGSEKTKILIMTHDIQTVFDIDKFMTEIKESNIPSPFNYKTRELRGGDLISFNTDKWQEYTNSINIIYDYANEKNINNNKDKEAYIGNTMRKVLEAFSTFTYKVDISKISTDQNILKGINPELVQYFENLLYRLVLNNESHSKEKIAAGNNIEFFQYISPEEKQITAKSVICFIYCLNKQHILNHLKGKANPEVVIEKWIDEIPNLS